MLVKDLEISRIEEGGRSWVEMQYGIL